MIVWNVENTFYYAIIMSSILLIIIYVLFLRED